MSLNIQRLLLLSFLFSCLTTKQFAQRINEPIRADYYLSNYSYMEDSLKGFDQNYFNKIAFTEGFTGNEYNTYINSAKRNFINKKYALDNLFFQNNPKHNLNSITAIANCNDEDFELGLAGALTSNTSVPGWDASLGTNTLTGGTCNLINCCPNFPNNTMIYSVPGGLIDAMIGPTYPIFSVFGSGPANPGGAFNVGIGTTGDKMYGSNFLRLNDPVASWGVSRIRKTIAVTSANPLFQYAVLPVFYTGHPCCDAGAFISQVLDVNMNVLSCPSFSVAAPNGLCVNASTSIPTFSICPNNASNIYSKWKIYSFDLTAFVNSTVTIELIATDCTAGAHYGYVYLDAQCSPFQVMINGTAVDLSAASSYSNCSSGSTATLSAPPNMGPYLWSGPASFTSSSQTFTTSTAGTYSLSMGAISSCTGTAKQITLNFGTSPTINVVASNTLLCSGSTATLLASGASTYSWSTGSTSNITVISPTTTTVYTVVGTNSMGCSSTSTINVLVTFCAGVSNLGNAPLNFNLYPNPNNGEFILKLENELNKGEVVIENTLGQIIYSQEIIQGENRIKTKTLSTGIYYYSILQNKQPVAKGKILIE